jgi:hypothetical protein
MLCGEFGLAVVPSKADDGLSVAFVRRAGSVPENAAASGSLCPFSIEFTADSIYTLIEASAFAIALPAVEVSALPPTSRVHIDLSIRVTSMALRTAAAASVSPR